MQRRPVIVSLSVSALVMGALVPMTAGPATGAPPAPEDTPPALRQPSSAPDPSRNAAAQPPAFFVGAEQRVMARPGGEGYVDLQIGRRVEGGVDARALTVQLRAPAGVRVVAGEAVAATEGGDIAGSYRCARQGTSGLDCTYRGDLSRGRLPDVLRARVAVSPAFRGERTDVTAKVTWNEDRLARGQRGDEVNGQGSPTFTVVGTRQKTLSDTAELDVAPALEVSLDGLTGKAVHVRSGGAPEARTGGLVATVSGLAGGGASAEWSQVSGPDVEWLDPVTLPDVAGSVSQRYVVPAGTPDGTTLRFAVAVVGNSQAAADEVDVVVRTHERGSFAARPELVRELSWRRTAPAGRGAIAPRNRYRVQIGDRGPTVVGPKSAGSLKVDVKGGPAVRSVKWSGPGRSLAKTSVRGNTLRFTAGKRPTITSVRALATLSDGSKISRTELVRVRPGFEPVKCPRRAAPKRERNQAPKRCRAAGKQKGGGQVRRMAVSATAAATTSPSGGDPASVSAFCDLRGRTTITLSDGSQLVVPAISLPAKCGAGTTENFTNAALTYDGTTLGNVTGSIGSSGVSIESVTFAVPSRLRPYLPASVAGTALKGTTPSGVSLGVPLTNGTWGALSGSVSLNAALSFLPLPTGWSATGELQFAPASNGDAALNLLVTAAGGSSGGHATMTVALANASQIQVKASNLAVLSTVAGDQLDFSGTATVPVGGTASVSLRATCPAAAASGACPLAQNLSLSPGATLTWKQGAGLTLTDAAVSIGSGATSTTLDAAGTFTAPGDWSMTVSQPASATWPIGSGGTSLSALTGTIGESPSGGTSEFVVDISGDVAGLSFGPDLQVTNLSADISNTCPPGATGCSPGQVTVGIDLSATATVFGDTVDFATTASVDLATGTVDYDTTAALTAATGSTFGPAGLGITNVTVTLTDESVTGSCQPQGSGSSGNGALSLGISADGTAFGQTISLNGDLNSDGYCLWGALGSIDALAGGDNILLAYSSYSGGGQITLPTNAGDPTATTPGPATQQVTVPASEILLQGQYTLPQGVSQQFSLPAGDVGFNATADTDLDGFTGSISYDLATPVFITGGSNGTTTSVATTLEDVALDLRVTTGAASGGPSAALSLDVDGEVVVAPTDGACGPSASSPGNASGCSYTSVGGSIGFTAARSGVSVNLQMGVDGTPVSDAFGQQGLTLDTLSLSASAGVPSALSLGFNGSAALPDSWTSSVELVNDPTVSLAFDLSETAPCLQFSIGDASDSQTVLDIGGAGVITATYVTLAIAPDGCTLPVGSSGSQSIDPGFAFAFDGAVLGDTTIVNISVSFEAQSGNPGMQFSETLQLDGFELGGAMSLQDTSFELQVNQDVTTPADNYVRAQFSGGMSVGDPAIASGTVDLNGYLNAAGDGDFTLVLGGDAGIELADGAISAQVSSTAAGCPSWTDGLPEPVYDGTPQPYSDCLVALQESDGQVQNFDVSAQLALEVLGTSLTGQADLVYSDGDLQDLHLELGATINFWVGNVGGAAYIDYCKGDLDTSGGTTNGQSCTIGGDTSDFRVYFAGEYTVGWCGDHWYDVCYQKDFSDTIVDTQSTDPGTPTVALNSDLGLSSPGAFQQLPASDYDPNLLWRQAATIGYLAPTDDVTAPSQTVAVTSVAPEPYTLGSWDVPACPSPTNGVAWTPTDGDNNPAPRNLTPITETCSIQVTYMAADSVWPEADFAANSTSASQVSENGGIDDFFGPPQASTAVCFPQGVSDAVPDAHCELYSDSESLGALTTPTSSGELSDELLAPFTQIAYGTLWPVGVMTAGVKMPTGSTVWSPDGQEYLNIQPDGNTVLYTASDYPVEGDVVPWWSNTQGDGVAYAEVTDDGVLGLYGSDDQAIWTSPAPAQAPSGGSPYLFVDDGMYTQQNDGEAIWSALPSNSAPSGDFDLYPNDDTSLCVSAADTSMYGELQGAEVTDDCGNGNFTYNTSGVSAVTGSQGMGQLLAPDGMFPYCLTDDGGDAAWLNDPFSPSACPIGDTTLWSVPGDMTVRGYWGQDQCLAVADQQYANASTLVSIQSCSNPPPQGYWNQWQIGTPSGQTLPSSP